MKSIKKNRHEFIQKTVFTVLGVAFIGLMAISISAQTSTTEPVCINLLPGDPTFNQTFDSFPTSGTTTTVPSGFGFSESGTNANNIITASTGSATAGDTYNFGAAGGTDRAFGTLRSSSLNPIIGGCFRNMTGTTLASFSIDFAGEQWRLGTINRAVPDRLDFQYSLDATSLLIGTYIDFEALDFVAPVTTGTVGALDGNTLPNRVPSISATVPGPIPDGTTFYIRFLDFDATGADDGLAIDSFRVTGNVTTAAPAIISGRVTAGRRGASREMVMLSGGDLEEPIYTTTNSFGYYRFEDLTVGETYVLQVISKRYRFANPSIVVSLQDNIANADFTALRK
jgi:hypothetical protein